MNDLPFLEITVLPPMNLLPRKRIWYEEAIWRTIKEYPLALRNKFEELMEFTYRYTSEGYSEQFFLTLGLDQHFFRRFVRLLRKTQNLERSFVHADGWNYELGYQWCFFRFVKCYLEHRIPRSSDSLLQSIRYRSNKGGFQIYGIYSWIDLLDAVLPEFNPFNKERLKMCGQAGLDRVSKYLRHQYEINGYLPRWDDNGSKMIAHALKKNVWVDFGIYFWSDLLHYAFGPKIRAPIHWKGKEGLKRARNRIQVYYNEHGTLPPSKDQQFWSIKSAIKKHYWDAQGICSWDDLTMNAVNQVRFIRTKPIYERITDLEQVKKKLKDFYDLNYKIPKYTDFPAIYSAACKKQWISLSICSWSDLLFQIFGRTNKQKGTWIGSRGLQNAQNLLLTFYQKNQGIPKSNDPLKKRIFAAIRHRRWKEWGVFTWRDILQKTFTDNQLPIKYRNTE